ncbi:MAG: sigma-70 family RNA polymerase sigma factor [Planctomycetia bacterium]|nr:sigma-70 family RNA polymerase sigma factor [Planctomycetia bacterium]
MATEAERRSAELLSRYRAGDERAAAELFERYVERLTALARSRLSERLASRTDPEDVVLSAYRSFFVGARAGRFSLRRSGDLWRLLVSITLHKLYRQAQHHRAQRRSIDVERPWESLDEHTASPVARQPTPEEALALAEELEAVLAKLDPLERQVLELRLQGEPLEQIAAATGRCERSVRRAMERVRERLAARLERNHDD